jgi:hypothetical protein
MWGIINLIRLSIECTFLINLFENINIDNIYILILEEREREREST